MKWKLMPQGVRMVKEGATQSTRSREAKDKRIAGDEGASPEQPVEVQIASELPVSALSNVDASQQPAVNKNSRRKPSDASSPHPVKKEKGRRNSGKPPHPPVGTEVIRGIETQLKNAILAAEERTRQKKMRSEADDRQSAPDGVKASSRQKMRIEPQLVLLLPSDSIEAECFALFHTLLSFPSARKTRRALLVTSAEPGRVLLVDCDLKHPDFSDLFGIDRFSGVSGHFAHGTPISWESDGNGSEFNLMSDEGDPQGLISCLFPSKAKRISPEWMDRFDERTVLLFFAPLSFPAPTPDETAHTDDVLVVIDYGVTPWESPDEFMERIGRDNILGCISFLKKSNKASSASTYAFGRYGRRA